eukprot:1160363-Pelagomonas_calceolata.AAC.1
MHRDDAFNHDLTLTGPRCCSTSLMYAFAQREDTVAYDEPLYARYDGDAVVQHLVEGQHPAPVVYAKVCLQGILRTSTRVKAECRLHFS